MPVGFPASNGDISNVVTNLQNGQADLLLRFLNKVGGARTIADGTNARVMITGDSTAVMGDVGGIVNGWGAYIANMLSTSGGINTSYDCVFANAPNLYFETRLSFGSSWSLDNTVNSILSATAKANTATNALTFSPLNPASNATLWYIQQPGGGVISLDGGGFGTVTVNTDGVAGVRGLNIANSFAPFNAKWVSGGQVNVLGFESWDINNPGITFMCGAQGASSLGNWADQSTGYAWLNAIIAMNPDLVIWDPGVNDMGNPLSSYIALMHTFASALLAAGIPQIILTPNPQNPNTSSGVQRSIALQNSFVNVNRQIASQYQIPLIDIYALIGSYARGSTLPLNFYVDDWVHPSSTGWGMVADAILSYLGTVMGKGRGGNTAATNTALFHALQTYGNINAGGNVVLANGRGVQIGSGGGAPRAGSDTLAAGTKIVFNSTVTNNTIIQIFSKGSAATNAGSLSASARVPNVDFTVLSSNALDTSPFDWIMTEKV